ncbi:MAG: helix-turn-helix domain-containing protein [Bradymonadales bacterium]|nr:MAG: helix-turn-helix domain-containing protein [Bradymonadales bacterium]
MKPTKTKVIIRNAKQLGAAIQRFRSEQKWPQVELSKRSGVKQPTISQVEGGAEKTRLATMFKLLAGLDLELVIRSRTKGNPET